MKEKLQLMPQKYKRHKRLLLTIIQQQIGQPIYWTTAKSKRGGLQNSFYKASIILTPKPTRTLKKRKLQANNPDQHRCKNLNKN